MAERNKRQQTSRELTRAETKRAVIEDASRLDAESDVYSEETGLTAQQWQAVALLTSGMRAVDVAQQVGVTPETISRWRAVPLFTAAYNQSVRDAYSATIGQVRDIAAEAIQTLRESLQSKDERVRLSAAMAILRVRLQLDAGALAAPTTPAAIARGMKEDALSDVLLSLY